MADDFEALRTIGAPVPELDAERAARMRARALSGLPGFAEERSGSVLTDAGVRADAETARPATTTTVEDGDAPRVLELVGSPVADPDLRSSAPRSAAGGGRTRRSFLAVAAAAAVLVVLVGLAVVRIGEPAGLVADQPRDTTVDGIADAAGLVVDDPLVPGEYAHLQVEQAQIFDAGGDLQLHVRTRETWAASDGSGREKLSAADIVDDTGQVVGTFDEDLDVAYPDDSPGFGVFGYPTLRDLPSDPAALRAVLRAGTFGPADDAGEAASIADLLTLDATPPAVRRAALLLLAQRGATVLPDAADHAGTRGIGIVVPQPDGATVVYVVTPTGLLLGTYRVAAGDPVDPAAAESWTSIQVRDRVTSTG